MVEVIAEIGSCHDGSLDQALMLIQTAKDCGATIVKAQFWSSAKRMAQRRGAPEYQAIYTKYQAPESWLPVLRAEANRLGLVFACSSYLPEDVETVAEYAEILKIANRCAHGGGAGIRTPVLTLSCRGQTGPQRHRYTVSLWMASRSV